MTIYLLKKKSVAHIWKDTDTSCKMWSTGGLNQTAAWIVTDDKGEASVCMNCLREQRKPTRWYTETAEERLERYKAIWQAFKQHPDYLSPAEVKEYEEMLSESGTDAGRTE